MDGNKKIRITLTADEWDDLVDVIYSYSSEMKYQYGEYLKKGMAKQALGDLVASSEAIAEKISAEIAKQENSNGRVEKH